MNLLRKYPPIHYNCRHLPQILEVFIYFIDIFRHFEELWEISLTSNLISTNFAGHRQSFDRIHTYNVSINPELQTIQIYQELNAFIY